MSLTEVNKRRIIENNKTISQLLRENENILKTSGYNPPQENYSVDRVDKIQVPLGYIREVKFFISKYHLRDICKNKQTRHNIAYALQESDLINFILSRVNVWGSVEAILYKLAIINLVSIMETIILEAVNNICCNTNKCGIISKCGIHFNGKERNGATSAIDKLVKLEILKLEEEKLTKLKEIIELRNTIHIRLANYNEMQQEVFCLENYNETVYLLQDITEQIYERAVPLYNCGIK